MISVLSLSSSMVCLADPRHTPDIMEALDSFHKSLINHGNTVVSDSIDGLLLSDSRLCRVSDLNVVVRSDVPSYKLQHVTIISGGGSGHEPVLITFDFFKYSICIFLVTCFHFF